MDVIFVIYPMKKQCCEAIDYDAGDGRFSKIRTWEQAT